MCVVSGSRWSWSA